MARSGFREEVFNIVLAQLLEERGVVSVPESIEHWSHLGRRMPDVVVEFRGLRTAIEGKVDDHPGAADAALSDVRRRLDEGVAHIAIAVLYPGLIRSGARNLDELRQALVAARFTTMICSEAGEHGWDTCDVDELGDLLRRTFNQLVQEDVVAESAAALQAGVERFAQALSGTPAVVERWANALGIRDPRPVASD
jgi:hypothetical protein